MHDISFLQRQPTRTRFATGRSVAATRRAVKAAVDDCSHVAAWNDDGLDVYAESDAGRFDDGYRSNVDVYEHDDGRTRVLVDSSSLRFVGSLDGTWTEMAIDVRPDLYHDAIVTAILATLTDTPKRDVQSSMWAPDPTGDPFEAIRDDFDEHELVDPDARDPRSSPADNVPDTIPEGGGDGTEGDGSQTADNTHRSTANRRFEDETDADNYEKAVSERNQIETQSKSRFASALGVILLGIGVLGLISAVAVVAAQDSTNASGLLSIATVGGLFALGLGAATLR